MPRPRRGLVQGPSEGLARIPLQLHLDDQRRAGNPILLEEHHRVRMRVRRLMVRRTGHVGRIHLINGAPTAVTFEIGRDEKRMVDWVGLTDLREGEHLWFDLTVQAADVPAEQRPIWSEVASPFFPQVSAGS